ncbi:retrovirus-related pol polyprotein from transposon TNT 1-94 [Tanacetum coccineum]
MVADEKEHTSGLRQPLYTVQAVEAAEKVGERLNVTRCKGPILFGIWEFTFEMENPWSRITHDKYYQALKPHRSNATSSSTRPSASTRHKGKEIAKPITPQSESVSVSDEDSDPEQAQRDKEMQKNLALLANLGIQRTIPLLGLGKNSRRQVDATTGITVLEEHYQLNGKDSGRSHLKESSSTGSAMANSNVTPDSSNICTNENQVDPNAVECVDERDALANLIANLTLDMEENKTILKQLKKANASLTQELEKCKTNLDETNSALGEAISWNAQKKLGRQCGENLKECECLALKLSKQTESVNNEVHNKLLKSYAKLEKHSISLELSLQHCKEQMKNNPVCKENASNVFRKEREQYHEIQDLKAQMQDKEHGARNPMRKSEDILLHTPYKETVASDTISEILRVTIRSLEIQYQEWKWWIAKRCPIRIYLSNVPSSSNLLRLYNSSPIIVDSDWVISGDADLEVAFRKNLLVFMVYGIEGFLILTSITSTYSQRKRFVNRLNVENMLKDQLCSSCEISKAKRSSFKTKAVPSSKGRLNLLHMDLCGPMRVASINGKKYILLSYTVRTDRGTEFLNKTLHAYFKEEGIEHQTSTPRTPEQNGVVERRNRTLVEAARRCFQLLSFHYHFGLKQLQPHAILRTDQSSYPLMERRHITS